MKISKAALANKLKNIKLLISDVDGVLTDGGIYLFDNGMEGKLFSVLDGAGCAIAHVAGLKTAWVTARKSALLALRANECHVTYLLQGQKRKLPALLSLLEKTGLKPEETAYIGDDVIDIPVMEKVGLAVAVPNAVDETKQAAHIITQKPGGKGALREIIEMILKAQKKWKVSIDTL